MTTQFHVSGPWRIAFTVNGRGHKRADTAEFWDEDDPVASQRGCYIFAIRNAGLLPTYVGKATKSFRQEIFTPDKLNKLNSSLHQWPHGTPVVLFVCTRTRGAAASKKIADLEKYLIRSAQIVNPQLLNKHHAGPEEWEIPGVTVPHAGARSSAERALRRALEMKG